MDAVGESFVGLVMDLDEEAVRAMWSSARTRDAITGYLDALKNRPR